VFFILAHIEDFYSSPEIEAFYCSHRDSPALIAFSLGYPHNQRTPTEE
jgi:hypothetical protein